MKESPQPPPHKAYTLNKGARVVTNIKIDRHPVRTCQSPQMSRTATVLRERRRESEDSTPFILGVRLELQLY